MSAETITQLILQYRYWIVIPLSFLEGPVVAFVAGTLVAAGVFNVYLLALILLFRDMVLDGAYYTLGYFGGATTFAKRMLVRVGITSDHLDRARELWLKRPFWTLFVGKLSYGIAAAFIVVAGMAKMPVTVFFKYGALVAVIQYALLMGAGYFLGASFGGSVTQIVNQVGYVLLIAVVVIIGYYFLSWRARQRLLEEDKEIEQLPPDA